MLQQDVTTRWNSMFCLLKSLLEQTWAHGLLSRLWSARDTRYPPVGFNWVHNFTSLPIWRKNKGDVAFAEGTFPSVVALKFLLKKL